MFQGTLKRLVRFGKPHEPAQKEIFVTAFGKHPGWNDHIDTIVPQTDFQAAFKRTLYVEGIQSNIESGAWDKIQQQGNQLVDFGHIFLGYSPPCYLVGKLWSSRDGKGRSLYPMVVCLQSLHISLQWTLRQGLGQLDLIEGTCNQTTSAARVQEAIKEAEVNLRAQVESAPIPPDIHRPISEVYNRLASLAELGPGSEGLYRILYFLDKEVARFLKTGQAVKLGKSPDSPIQPKLLRIPVESLTVAEALELWTELLRAYLQVDMPLTMFFSAENSWMDIIVGEPTALQIFCLRAHLNAIPLTSSIPYTLDTGFSGKIQERLGIR